MTAPTTAPSIKAAHTKARLLHAACPSSGCISDDAIRNIDTLAREYIVLYNRISLLEARAVVANDVYILDVLDTNHLLARVIVSVQDRMTHLLTGIASAVQPPSSAQS